MKYSIIVPIYKTEQYLIHCIESVLQQTFGDWELILVDDGSPDNCPVICDNYAAKDPRIKVIHKKNGGLVSARRAGLDIAIGEYALCLDSDDYWKPDLLNKVNEQVILHHPDVVCFGYICKSDAKEKNVCVPCNHFGFYSKDDLEKYIYPNLIHTKTLSRFPPVVWAKAFEMKIYKTYQNKVDFSVGMGEDGACSYPIIANAKSMVILEECLYYYRYVVTSMTKFKKPLSWDNYDKIFALYRREIDLEKCNFDAQICRAQTHLLFDICKSQFYSNLKYKDVVNSIQYQFDKHLEYENAIENSSFISFKMIFARLVLKYRLYPLLYLASKLL